jgi:hypothetical protein
MPTHDTPYRPARRFPTVSTGIALIQRSPELARQLKRIFGPGRTLEILFETSPLRHPMRRSPLGPWDYHP